MRVLKIFIVILSANVFVLNTYAAEKICGTLRDDMKYTMIQSDGQKTASSQVELCLDKSSGGVACGVTSDPLLISTIHSILSLKVEEICFKFDDSNPRNIIFVQSKLF